MSFMTANGLDLTPYLDNFKRTYSDIQTFDRTEGLTYEGALFAEKRTWSFELPWDPSEVVPVSNRHWLKGRGHYWTFERVDGATTRFNRYSAEGGPGFEATLTASCPRFGTWGGLVASAGSSTVTVTFGSDNRYSVSMWKLNTSSSWILQSAVYDGGTLRYYANNGPTTAFGFTTLTAASGFFRVSLLGKNEAASNATAMYDGIYVVPYALTTQQIAARVARTTPEPAFPHLEIDGDFLEDLNPVLVKGFVEEEELTQVQSTVQGGNIANTRMLKVTLVER